MMIQTSMRRFAYSLLAVSLALGAVVGSGLLLSACGAGGRGNGPGDDSNDPRAMCASMSEQWQASIASLENRCTTVEDCMVVGEPGSCACGSTVTGDCGTAVARASYMGSEAERVAQRFEAEDCSFPSICGCGPTQVECSPEGQCVFTHQFCLDESDAGAAAASDTSAEL
jgi:hypothetical protein